MASTDTPIDVLRLTATEAQQLLQTNQTTSVSLVKAYLAQIEKHNHAGLHLNALISVASSADILRRAADLDAERSAGHVRSPFHGIPFIIKDVFATAPDLGMPCTAGAPCFRAGKMKRTAPIVQRLLDQGMLLLGKANMTEFCGMKMEGLTPGWSPMGGQTQSPYIIGGLEEGELMLGNSSGGGSSSGSASSVAAGFAPLSIGTECCGSLITPANREALYALKCGLATTDGEGMFRYSDCMDCTGGMAKSVRDLSVFTQILMDREEEFEIGGGFQGMRVGFVDLEVWKLMVEICKYSDEMTATIKKGFRRVQDTLKEKGAEVKTVELEVPHETFKIGKTSMIQAIAFYQLRRKFLPEWFDEFDECEVRTLEEMIKYNGDHANVCMPPSHPTQGEFHDLLNNKSTETEIQEMIDEMQRRGNHLLDGLFQTVDVIVGLTESPLCMYSSAAGCPIACVPFETVTYSAENERPYGLCIMAPRGGEELLLRFMAAFEAAFPSRPLPRQLM